MISPELQKAIDCLQIQDVYLRGLSAGCADNFEPKYHDDYERLIFQTRHYVKKTNVVELNDDPRMMRVFIDLGVRWVEESAAGEEAPVKAFIEAEFVAEYTMTEDLEQAAIDAFSLQNVSFHVWPYWRELLHNQCSRMHLPQAVLPAIQLAQNRESSSQ